MRVNPLTWQGGCGTSTGMDTSSIPSLTDRRLKGRETPGRGDQRLWDCPVSGGPFCPLDTSHFVVDGGVNPAFDCPECGGFDLVS